MTVERSEISQLRGPRCDALFYQLQHNDEHALRAAIWIGDIRMHVFAEPVSSSACVRILELQPVTLLTIHDQNQISRRYEFDIDRARR
ncbi:hypothetical protein AWV79_05595 [Cupriavidus sp. UYMMa02A]|nr:hypothetical protein AWV79_05595 [Cupriavidus sp. UYMMa02A]